MNFIIPNKYANMLLRYNVIRDMAFSLVLLQKVFGFLADRLIFPWLKIELIQSHLVRENFCKKFPRNLKKFNQVKKPKKTWFKT